VGVATNVQELCDAIKNKTSHGVYIVKETEEAKYTIAGTIPFEKIDNALVLDQGGSNTKGGYIVKDGERLTGVPTNFDLGSVRVADLIVSNYMTSQPDDQNDYRVEFVKGMNKCFDSLKIVIKRTFSNIEGAESRDELYLSGGASFAVATLMYPEAPLNQQMVKIDYVRLKSFLDQIQDRDFYKSLRDKTFSDEKVQKNYKSALNIYTQLQLISATKLLVTFVGALGGDDKQIYFNRYGLHSMPSILIGRVLRGDVQRW
jgi:exopolyphosphatase/pppGpp-phosphohydrolase